ncbi:uncharacterized protein RCH25_044187 [Pelodytes ibericus]
MSNSLYQVSVTFHDVAACFPAEEWGLLEDWQKELYRNVMRQIHTALLAMGFEIINPDVLFRIKKVKEDYTNFCDVDRPLTSAACPDPDNLLGVKQERGSDLSRSASSRLGTSPDILLRIKPDHRPAGSEYSENSATHSPGEPIVTSVFSLQVDNEEEEDPHLAHCLEAPTAQIQKRFMSQPIKQESLDYVNVSVGGSAPERITATPQERVTSHPIKQEALDYVGMSVGGSAPDVTSPPQDTAEEPTGSPPSFPGNTSSHGDPPALPSSLGPHRVRKYTDRELEVLVHMVAENYPKLFGNESAKTPSSTKEAIWQSVADEVNTLGVDYRTTEKVKKRWMYAKRQMKRKLKEAAQHIAETGRQPPPYLRLAPYEQQLRDFFMPEFREEVQWVGNERGQQEEEEPVAPESLTMSHPPPSPPSQDAEEESAEETSEEHVLFSPGPGSQSSDHVVEKESRPKSDQLNDDHKAEASGREIPDPYRLCSQQMQDRHLSTISVTLCRQSDTLHAISSHQRESNSLMQEQNAILSQISYSLSLLQVQQTEGLAAVGGIIQKGIDAMKPSASNQGCTRTMQPPSLQEALRRQMMQLPRTSSDHPPVPHKRKLT